MLLRYSLISCQSLNNDGQLDASKSKTLQALLNCCYVTCRSRSVVMHCHLRLFRIRCQDCVKPAEPSEGNRSACNASPRRPPAAADMRKASIPPSCLRGHLEVSQASHERKALIVSDDVCLIWPAWQLCYKRQVSGVYDRDNKGDSPSRRSLSV